MRLGAVRLKLLHKNKRISQVTSASLVSTLTTVEMNATEGPACRAPYEAGIGEKVGRTLSLALLMAVTLVGNSLVIWVFKRNPALRTNMNYFVINMVASDLLYPFVLLPRQLVFTWLGHKRILVGGNMGDFLCKLSPLAVHMSAAVSIQSLVLIAVERYIAVAHPLKSKLIFSPRRRAILITVTWVAAMLIHSPYWFIYRLETRCETRYCVKDWIPWFDTRTANSIYEKILCIFLTYIPLLSISILYTFLALSLKKVKAPGVYVDNRLDIGRRKRNRRITKMSACIVIAFALSVLPLAVYITIKRLVAGIPHRLILVYVVLHLAWANSAVNPWILFYFCGNFRRGLRGVCERCICRRTSNSAAIRPRDIELQE